MTGLCIHTCIHFSVKENELDKEKKINFSFGVIHVHIQERSGFVFVVGTQTYMYKMSPSSILKKKIDELFILFLVPIF